MIGNIPFQHPLSSISLARGRKTAIWEKLTADMLTILRLVIYLLYVYVVFLHLGRALLREDEVEDNRYDTSGQDCV